MAETTSTALMTLSMPFYPGKRPWATDTLFDPLTVDAEAYVKALSAEALGAAPDFADVRVPAILVGGGIATHMADGPLGVLLRSIRQSYVLEGDDGGAPEITLRAHPGFVSAATIDACRIGHVNRLRIDFATGSEAEARELGRTFGPSTMEITQQVIGRFKLDLGFELLVGIPGQTTRSAVASVDTVLKFGATSVHVSEFCLPPASELAKERAGHTDEWRELPLHRMPALEQRAEILANMEERLRDEGFAEYLPGEWALPGHESRYLQLRAAGLDVLGFGLGARTRFQGVGAENTTNLATYLESSADPTKCIAKTYAL